MGEEIQLLFEPLFLVRRKTGPGNFINLVGKDINPSGRIAFTLVKEAQLILKLAPGAIDDAECRPEFPERGATVEHLQVVLHPQQGLGFMLAVDIDELAGDFSQQRQCGDAAVKEDPVLAGTGDDPFHQQFISGVDTFCGEEFAQGRLRGKVKQRLHGRLFGTGTNEVASPPGAEEEIDRVDDNRLAGAGLAGKDIQAGTESDMERVDDCQIFDGNVGQHINLTRQRRNQPGKYFVSRLPHDYLDS